MRTDGILLIGADGFLGRRVAERLASGPRPLRMSSRKAAPGRISLSAADRDLPEGLFDGVGTVVHVAGLAHAPQAGDDAFDLVNRLFPGRVAAAAARAGVAEFVLVSSVSVYGQSAEVRDETASCAPQGAYAVSKLAGEHAVADAARGSSMRTVALRLATLYGPGDPGNLGKLARAVRNGRFVAIGNGANGKSVLHVDDAAEAMAVVVARGLDDGALAYNVVGETVPVSRILAGIAAAAGRGPLVTLPAPPVRAVSRLLSALSAGRGPFGRIDATIAKWLQDDLYSGEKFAHDFAFNATRFGPAAFADLLA